MPQRVVRENNRKRQAQDSQLPTQSCWGDGAGLLLFLCFGNFCKKSPTALFFNPRRWGQPLFRWGGGAAFWGISFGANVPASRGHPPSVHTLIARISPQGHTLLPEKGLGRLAPKPKTDLGGILVVGRHPKKPSGLFKSHLLRQRKPTKTKIQRKEPSVWLGNFCEAAPPPRCPARACQRGRLRLPSQSSRLGLPAPRTRGVRRRQRIAEEPAVRRHGFQPGPRRGGCGAATPWGSCLAI